MENGGKLPGVTRKRQPQWPWSCWPQCYVLRHTLSPIQNTSQSRSNTLGGLIVLFPRSSSVFRLRRLSGYKQRLFSDPVSTFADVYIVGKSTMKEIADVSLTNDDAKRPSSSVGPRTSPALRLVLATGMIPKRSWSKQSFSLACHSVRDHRMPPPRKYKI